MSATAQDVTSKALLNTGVPLSNTQPFSGGIFLGWIVNSRDLASKQYPAMVAVIVGVETNLIDMPGIIGMRGAPAKTSLQVGRGLVIPIIPG